jgi:hypothetical protein
MAVELYSTATEYVATELTELRGDVADIVSVGVYYDVDPNVIPDIVDFTTVTLVDGTAEPPDPLSEVGQVDVLALIGPRAGDVTLAGGAGGVDYQEFVLVVTASEDIIRKTGVVTVL